MDRFVSVVRTRVSRRLLRRTVFVACGILLGVLPGLLPGASYSVETAPPSGPGAALGDTPPTVSIEVPGGGEQYEGGSRQNIEYTVFDADEQPLTVTIEHSTNGGTSWQQLLATTNTNGSFAVGWDVPNTTYADGRVRVTANDGVTGPVLTVSNAFSVVAVGSGTNTLTVGTNSGGVGSVATLSVGLANDDVVKRLEMDVVFDPEILSFQGVSRLGRAVAFEDTSFVVTDGTVRVLLEPPSGQTIAEGSGSILSLSFQLDASGQSDVTPSGVVLTGVAENALDVTPVAGVLTVTGGAVPVISLVAPQGGETLVGGGVETIQYVASGGSGDLSVTIEYSANGGSSYVASGTDLVNTGAFLWSVPTAPTTGGRIRVTASDGTSSASDESGVFSITTSSGGNVLAVGSADGAGGAVVTVPLTMTNADELKALQFDLLFDSGVVAFSSAEATGRGAAMDLTMQTVAVGRARGVMHYSTEQALGVGSGEIATIHLQLLGTRGAQSVVEPTAILLSDADANEIPDGIGQPGVITVTSDPVGPPRVDLSVLRNPGRPRHLQVFVAVSNGSGGTPQVSAGSANVTMASLGGGVFVGTVFLDPSVTSVTVTATDTVGDATGTDSETVRY
ncbi:MAG: cohesin domain-containing protein [Candidatus Eisenbacteria bacterium]